VKDESKFVALIDQEGRVRVDITGPHVNNRTLSRIVLAIKKTYKNHIKAYRKQLKLGMTEVEIDSIVAEPANITVEQNGRVLDEVVSPITKPIAEAVESKKLSIQEVIDAKRAQKLAQTTK